MSSSSPVGSAPGGYDLGGFNSGGDGEGCGCLIVLALLPLFQVRYSFEYVQRSYVVTGAFFIPMLALLLLIMNGHRGWIGRRHRSHPLTSMVLITMLLFFAWAGYLKLRG